MRTVRVETNRSCLLHCRHCDCSPREDAEVVRAAPGRIAEAKTDGFAQLLLAGGEPLLRKDLERLIAFAKHGARRLDEAGPGARVGEVVLETTGVQRGPGGEVQGLDRARAQALRDAGLDRVRLQLPGWGPDHDRITGVAGSFVAARDSLLALATVGLPVELELPLLLRAEAPELCGQVIALGVRPVAVWLRLPSRDPDPIGLIEAVAAIEACDRTIGALADPPPVQLALDRNPPPCLFSSPGRSAHLFALTRGGATRSGYRKLDACEACSVRDRCPGLPEADLARDPSLAPRPLADDRTRRRLTLVHDVEQQIARELVSHELGRDVHGNTWLVHTVRVQFRCNQACDFCFVSTHLPDPPNQAVYAALDAAAAAGAVVSMSGGEPTLNPRLCDYLRYAKQAGVPAIELQTNAVRLADPRLCADVVAAGIDTAFVSLHGSRAEIGDGITNAPGTWAKTVAGLDQLAAHGVATRVNFVMCQQNADDFPAVVELVATRWPCFDLTFSFVAPSTDLVPRTAALIPRYSAVFAPLLAGLERARALGVTVTGFESMCSIPLCLKPDGLGDYEQLSPAELGVGDSASEFEKPPVCAGCSQRERCWGVRRGYVSLYGSDELRPFAGSP